MAREERKIHKDLKETRRIAPQTYKMDEAHVLFASEQWKNKIGDGYRREEQIPESGGCWKL